MSKHMNLSEPGLQGESELLQGESDFQDSFLVEIAGRMTVIPVPTPGERLGGVDSRRYEIIQVLGAGGMGKVFQAMDHELQRIVALKFLLPNLGLASIQRMASIREEAQAIARFDHENIVRVHDVSEWTLGSGVPGGTLLRVPFIVMEYLRGESLHEFLRKGRPGLRRTLEIMTDVAAGLAHAHERGLLHRDLKPDNVFILPNGRAKLLDFGLAQLTASASAGSAIEGTPGYMAPEQWRGGPLDARTDVWAAGLLLFELLTGRLPFPELNSQQLRARLTSGESMPSVSEHHPELPVELERLVAETLAVEPAKRPASGAVLLERLHELGDHLVLRPPQASAGFTGRRQVTLVSCRLVAVPSTAESLDPEDYSELEAAFHHASTSILRQHGGAITTAIGDEVLACFGFPTIHEEDSEQAVRAALHLKDALPQELSGAWPSRLAVKVGIHTDWVTLGEALPELHGTTPAMQGEAPRIAGWLSTQAEPNTVLLSNQTYHLVRGGFEFRALEPRSFPGFTGAAPFLPHQVLQEHRSESRFDRALVVGALTPLVGREHELGQLAAWWEEAHHGRGTFILLRGEAGIGKSRLVQEFHDREPPEASTWARCQCWPQYQHSAFYPLLDWLQRDLELSAEDSPEGKKQKLEARLETLDLSPEHTSPLASLLSLPVPADSPFLHLAPDRQRERSLESLVALLQRLAEPRPLVFLVEDLHWADPSTLQFLGLLLEHVGGTRLCVLLTARPSFEQAWVGRPGVHSLELEPLPPEAISNLVRSAARGQALPEGMVPRLVARADGIPLFAEELTRMLLEQHDKPLAIPSTLRELLQARLDQLPSRRRALVQLAATLGREFSHEMLRAISFLREDELPPELERLQRAGLLFQQGQPPHTLYAFKHSLIQDAAYQSLPRATRQRYHARIVQALTEQFPKLVEEQPELLAQHSTRAGLTEQALEQWQRAGQRAVAKSALPEALGHYTQAFTQLSRQPPSRERDRRELALQLELGNALVLTKGFTAHEVEEVFARARALCEQSEDLPLPVLWGLVNVAVVRGDRASMDQLAHHLQRHLDRKDDPGAQIVAHAKLATQAFWQGEYASCQWHCERAKALAREEGPARLLERISGGVPYLYESVFYARLYLAYAEMMRGRAETARREYQEALALAESTHYPYAIATVLMFGASLAYESGWPEQTHAIASRAISLSAENGFPFTLAIGQCLEGWAVACLGDLEGGIATTQAGLGLLKAMGALVVYPRKLTYLIATHLRGGRLEEGLAAVREGLTLCEKTFSRNALPELRRLQGELLLRGGQEEAARVCMRQALVEAHAFGARLHELRAAVSLARLLRRSGELGEARALLMRVLDSFTEGFDVGDYQAARELLEEEPPALSL